jgi:hypothetical protein
MAGHVTAQRNTTGSRAARLALCCRGGAQQALTPPCQPLQIAQPLYNLTDLSTNLTSNTPPHCAQLYNPRGLPWAFHHLPMAQRADGFPVWIDINLSADDAQTW